MITITRTKSDIGATQAQRHTLHCLGLRKRHATAQVYDTPIMRGMIRSVLHMICVHK